MRSKVVSSIREAVELAGLKDGMTVSFHHHLRNGDYVLNTVMDQIADMGIKELTVNASSLFALQAALGHIKNRVVAKIPTNYMAEEVGREIPCGIMDRAVEFRTHGGRPSDIALGARRSMSRSLQHPSAIPWASVRVNGKSPVAVWDMLCGCMYADKVVIITDELASYPLMDWSIEETCVDYVVKVDAIGDPAGIVSGTTRITRDPVGLVMAEQAALVIRHSGLLKEGFSFQTGAGGASLAASKFLKEIMLKENIRGSFGLGGITGYLVDMLHAGCFEKLLDVQCFDLDAVESIRKDPRHQEISAEHYASPGAKSAVVDSLDVDILGAAEMTGLQCERAHGLNGYIMGAAAATAIRLQARARHDHRSDTKRDAVVTDRVTYITLDGMSMCSSPRQASQSTRECRPGQAC